MDGREMRVFSGCWGMVMLSSFFILHLSPLCAHGSSLGVNVTEADSQVNSSSLPGVMTSSGPLVPLSKAARKLKDNEELGSGILGEETVSQAPDNRGTGVRGGPEISQDSAEVEHLLKIQPDAAGAGLPTQRGRDGANIPLDFIDQDDHQQAWPTDPPWQSTNQGGLATTVLDLDLQLPGQPPSPTPALAPSQPQVLTVDYMGPASSHRDLELISPEPPPNELQGGDPTALALPNDYLNPYMASTTEASDYDQDTITISTEDQDLLRLTTTPPSMPFDPNAMGSLAPDDTLPSGGADDYEPPAAPGAVDVTNGSDCRPGYVRHNATCRSPCDLFPSYCFNGGQCYLEGTTVFCRCNVQDYIWHKGTRCEAVITEFQVMCIAVGAAAFMVLLLFMVTVCFAKKLHQLKTENRKLRKRSSKYRPPSEQHNDNFSLSTIAEGSHPNKTISRYTWECKTKEEPDGEDDVDAQNKLEDPVKAPPPKEDESLNIQNSLTPKHENNKAAGEENSSEVNSLQNNMM